MRWYYTLICFFFYYYYFERILLKLTYIINYFDVYLIHYKFPYLTSAVVSTSLFAHCTLWNIATVPGCGLLKGKFSSHIQYNTLIVSGTLNFLIFIPNVLCYWTYLSNILLIYTRPEHAWHTCQSTSSNQQSII